DFGCAGSRLGTTTRGMCWRGQMLSDLRWPLLLVLAQARFEAHVITDRVLKRAGHLPSHVEMKTALHAIEDVFGYGDAARCGVVAELHETAWKPYEGGDVLPCGKHLATNCTISYHQMHCPEECPYLAPDMHFPCQFSCHTADECAKSNVDLAYADDNFLLCGKCSVTACALCDTESTCTRCHSGFHVNQDGTKCIFNFTSSGWASLVFYVLVGLIVGLVVTAFTYCLRGSRSPNAMENRANLALGLRHRHLAKVQDWDLKSNKKPRIRYPLFVDLAKENILGVGFALFYRSIVFMLVISVISAGFLWNMSAPTAFVHSTRTSISESLAEALAHIDPPKATIPAVIISPLMNCPSQSPLDMTEPLKYFAKWRAYALGLLYGALFAVSAYFVRSQKAWNERFDAKSNTMCDFAILLQGFPESATNEVELKKWAQESVKKSGLPDIEVEGVSVGYNYGDRVDAVDEMTDRFCTAVELEMRKESGMSNDDVEEEWKKLQEMISDDRNKVRGWFEQGELKGTGQVFVCFKSNFDKDTVMEKLKENPRIFEYKDAPIQADVILSEPPDVFWQNLHTKPEEISANEKKALFEVGIWFFGINFIVFIWNKFVVMPYLSAGSSAGGPIVIIQGIIMAIINAIFGGKIWGGAYGAGYHRKDRADVWLFFVNFFITFCNTIFNLALMCYSVLVLQKEQFLRGPGYLDVFSSATNLGQESDVADRVYMMLVPGQLFTGPLNSLLTGTMLNYVLNILWAKMIYVWKCLPDPGLQFIKILLPHAPNSLDKYKITSAERGMSGPSIGLPWDYSSLLLNPFLVFMTFFMISDNCFKLCIYLALACIFNYGWSRFMHLRVQSATFYSTGRLDLVV
ncbi:Hypothetical protein SCF082_LOCUS23769, partial [Durusdinium trenchii]